MYMHHTILLREAYYNFKVSSLCSFHKTRDMIIGDRQYERAMHTYVNFSPSLRSPIAAITHPWTCVADRDVILLGVGWASSR